MNLTESQYDLREILNSYYLFYREYRNDINDKPEFQVGYGDHFKIYYFLKVIFLYWGKKVKDYVGKVANVNEDIKPIPAISLLSNFDKG